MCRKACFFQRRCCGNSPSSYPPSDALPPLVQVGNLSMFEMPERQNEYLKGLFAVLGDRAERASAPYSDQRHPALPIAPVCVIAMVRQPAYGVDSA